MNEIPQAVQIATVVAVGLLTSLITTIVILRRGDSWGLDSPDGIRKHHPTTVPRTGGLPAFLGVSAAVVLIELYQPGFIGGWWPVLLCCTLIFSLGFIDDLYPLGAKVKLAGQIGVALIAFGLNLSIERLSNPFGEGALELGSLALPITVLWLIAITNIINLIDGMDGLATGLGMFICLAIGVVGLHAQQQEVALISLSLGGALLGFLFFNFPPAKIFLGDGGAYFIGFFIASVSMASSYKGTVAAALFVVMVALGLPILDTTFAILRRAVRGMPLFRADAEHIHHRLLLLGFSKTTALFTLYAICGLLSLLGLSFLWARGMALPVAGAALFLLALGAARYLGYIGRLSELQEQLSNALARRKEIQLATSYCQLLELELERCTDPDEYWLLFDHALARIGMSRTETPGTIRIASEYRPDLRFVLFAPTSRRNPADWKAISECLMPAYSLAVERWGIPEAKGEHALPTPDPEAAPTL